MLCGVCYDWPVVSRPFIVFFFFLLTLFGVSCRDNFFGGFGPPSLVVLIVRNTLKLGPTKFLYPACCTIRLLFCTLSVCVCSFHPFAIWREGDVWGPWLFHQVQHAATLRKPTALHETTRTAVSPWDQTNCCKFPDVSSSGVAGCEITPLRNIMRHTWHPGEEKGYKWANDHASWSWSLLLH